MNGGLFQFSIICFMKKLSLFLLFTLLLAQVMAQTAITGQVTDENGEPLPGATVMISELKKGTAANETGVYQFEDVPAGDFTLQASFVGYESVKLKTQVKASVQRLILHIQLKERVVKIDELIVQATRAGKYTPVTYSNLDEEAIAVNNLGQDVPYLLRWTPSAVVTSDAGTGIGYTGIRIRGTDPTRINVTINGIPLNDAESQGVFWVDLPDFVSSTNDIQIQRGVGTSTNGAGAFGATINLNTAKIEQEPYLELNGTAGSFNTLKGNIQFGTGLLQDKFSLDGRFSRISSDGYIDRGAADLESFYFSGAYVGDKQSLRLNVFQGHEVTYQAWNGVAPDLIDDRDLRTTNTAGTERAGEPHDNEVDDYEQTHYQLLYNNQLNRNLNLNLALHYTKGAGFFEQYKATQFFSDYSLPDVVAGGDTLLTTDLIRRRWLDNDFYGTTFSLVYTSDNNRLEWINGGAYNQYDGRHFGEIIWARNMSDAELGHRYYDNEADKNDFNFYSKVNYQVIAGLYAFADLQVRSITYDLLGFDDNGAPAPQSADYFFFNPKVGLLYELGANTTVYGSFAVANREPNRNDFLGRTISDPPQSERLMDTELGIRKQWKKGNLDVNGYYMSYQDQLALSGAINDVGEFSRINIDDSYRLGLEVVGGYQGDNGLYVQANATISQNRVKQFVEEVDVYDSNFFKTGIEEVVHEDTDLSFSPDLIAGGEFGYNLISNQKKHLLNIALLSKYVGEQFIDNTSDEANTIDAYYVQDFRLKYTLKTAFVKEIGLTLLVRNVFDSLYEANAWSYRYVFEGTELLDQGFYPQAGRNFLLGLQLKF